MIEQTISICSYTKNTKQNDKFIYNYNTLNDTHFSVCMYVCMCRLCESNIRKKKDFCVQNQVIEPNGVLELCSTYSLMFIVCVYVCVCTCMYIKYCSFVMRVCV